MWAKFKSCKFLNSCGWEEKTNPYELIVHERGKSVTGNLLTDYTVETRYKNSVLRGKNTQKWIQLVFQNKDVFKYSLYQWFSKYELWTISLSIPWDHVRNVNFQISPPIHWVRNSEDGTQQSILTRLPSLWFWCSYTNCLAFFCSDMFLAPTTALECRLYFVADSGVGGCGWWTEHYTSFWRSGQTALSFPGCVTLGKSAGLSVSSSMK